MVVTLFSNEEKDSLVLELIIADAEVIGSEAIFSLCFCNKKKTSFFSLFRVVVVVVVSTPYQSPRCGV